MGKSKEAVRAFGVGRLIGIGVVFMIALGAILAVPLFASAAESGDSSGIRSLASARVEDEDGDRPFPGHFGHRGFKGYSAIDVTAELTGTERADVIAALQDGASLASYAAEFGVSESELVDAITLDAEEMLAEKVANGDLTQEDADARLADLKERVTELVNMEGFVPRHNCGDEGDEDAPTEETTSDTV